MKTVKSLKSASKTEIFNFVAKKFGSENIKQKVYDYLNNHSVYGSKIAYRMAYNSGKIVISSFINTPIANINPITPRIGPNTLLIFLFTINIFPLKW